ncbi:MAG: sigma-54-dependent Fis family transcriptional regulator, partial [Bacteroidia bacterium]|nr:sigma-54-dependent Fis family transcriptional regulator [Bacteroidia bacterium]
SYPWQGNVRELKTVIERAVLMCESDTITTKDLEFETLTPTDQFFAQEHTMEEYKYKIFHLYLQKFNNNVDTVAKKLKIGRATAFRMLKKKEF